MILLLIALLSLSTAFADPVTSVHDGDSFTVEGNRKIRVWGIDSPELEQPYGYTARDYAQKALTGQDVRLDCHGKTWKRDICKVTLNGKDFGEAIVSNGLAYDSPEFSGGFYASVEKLAQERRAGVWASGEGLKPWEFRAQKRTTSKKSLQAPHP